MAELAHKLPQSELVNALGREGRQQTKPTDAQRSPHTVAMQAKPLTDKGKSDHRKRKWILAGPYAIHGPLQQSMCRAEPVTGGQSRRAELGLGQHLSRKRFA